MTETSCFTHFNTSRKGAKEAALQVLNLEGNPDLKSLPSFLGQMEQLIDIRLTPSL